MDEKKIKLTPDLINGGYTNLGEVMPTIYGEQSSAEPKPNNGCGTRRSPELRRLDRERERGKRILMGTNP